MTRCGDFIVRSTCTPHTRAQTLTPLTQLKGKLSLLLQRHQSHLQLKPREILSPMTVVTLGKTVADCTHTNNNNINDTNNAARIIFSSLQRSGEGDVSVWVTE